MHEIWQDSLPFYVAGSLSPYEQAAIEQHLADCAVCRDIVAMWRTVSAAVREDVNARTDANLPALPAGEWGRRKGMLAIKRQNPVLSRSFRAVAGYILSAATLLLVLGMLLSTSGSQHPSNRNTTNQAVIVLLTPVPSPSPTPAPLPEHISLSGINYEAQMWNNDGPANLSMALSYYGWEGDQRTTRQWLRPNFEDKSVTLGQMVEYVNEQTPYRAIYRLGGTMQLLKQILAAGYPVIIEEGFQPEGEDWMAHYLLLMGYDETQKSFLAYDSYLGSNQDAGYPHSYSRLDENWRHFNRTFIVVYDPSQELVVQQVLGDYVDPQNAYQIALQTARDEANNNPDDKWAWLNMGSAYLALDDYSNAADAYDQARQKNLPWRITWYQFGPYEAYYNVGRYDDVVALAEATLATTPYVEETYYWLGMAEMDLGDPEAALKHLGQVFDYNPNFRPSLSQN